MDERETNGAARPSDGAETVTSTEPHADGDKPTGQAGTGQSGGGESNGHRKPAPDDTGN
jgi:hypothetical protein